MNSNVLRFIAFFSLILLITFGVTLSKKINFSEMEMFNIKVYFNDKTNLNFPVKQNGLGVYVETSKDNLQALLKEDYEGLSFETKLNLSDFLSKIKAKIIKKQEILINNEQKTIIYGFSNVISNNFDLEKSNINFQIVVNENALLVGIPLLLGSY